MELPSSIIRAYVEAIPKIQSERSLVAIRDYQLGTGNMKPAVARAVIRALQRAARQGTKRRAGLAKTPEQAALLLASMGINYQVKE